MTSTVAPTLTGLTPAEKDAASALVAVIDRCSRMIATIEAMKASALAQLASIAHESGERSANPDGVDYSRRAMAAEVAAATHTHPVAAKHAMEDAEILTRSYPETHAALASGAISVKHARVVMDAGSPLDPLRRSIFDRVAAPIATDMTPGDLARIAKKRSSDMAGLSFDERHEWARRRRYVSVTDLDDGMSMLRVLGPSLELHAVYDRATKLGKIVAHDRTRVRDEYRRAVGHPVGADCDDEHCRCRAGRAATVSVRDRSRTGHANGADPSARPTQASRASAGGIAPEAAIAATDHRTLDQVRTDILLDLLLGAEPTGHDLHSAGSDATLAKIHADVQVTIPATMIIDTGAAARAGTAWLDAGTLISPDTARRLAGTAAGWERLFYRPDTGQVEHVDTYRPSAWQKRTLIGRDLTCRFPGCTTPARKADIDHTRAFAEGGRTTIANMACLCEAHHVMKHRSDWQVRQLEDGVIEWTSPTGRSYEAEPPSRVFFREEPAPDPRDSSALAAPDADEPPPWDDG